MGFRWAPTAVIVLVSLAAGKASAEPGWTVNSPAIVRKSTRGAAAAALAVLAVAGVALLRRRRR